MSRSRFAVACGLVPLIVLTACGSGDAASAAPAATVRDSAGIQIGDVARTVWAEGEGWTVAPEPIFEIGMVEGDEAHQLFRVADAIRLPNGNVVLANRGTQELRWFDPSGRFVRSAGGAGEGPGEFDSLFSLRLLGDTLWAHDFRVARITAFDTAGALRRTVVLDREPGLPIGVWPATDGFIGFMLEMPLDISAELTYHRRTSRYFRFAADGSLRDTIADLPGLEFLIRGGPTGGNSFVMASTSPLIGHSSQQTAVGDRLVAGSTDRFEIRVYGADNRLERIIRDASRTLPVTDAEWNAVFDEAMAEAETPDARRNVQSLAELRPAPETRPAFDAFLADRLGFLWVEPYRPAKGQPVSWLVIDIERGEVLGSVALPEGLRPTDIGEDWVLGVMSDELDVEHVRMYRLERGSP